MAISTDCAEMAYINYLIQTIYRTLWIVWDKYETKELSNKMQKILTTYKNHFVLLAILNSRKVALQKHKTENMNIVDVLRNHMRTKTCS